MDDRYPDNWSEFAIEIKTDRALDRCECAGECGIDHRGRCENRKGMLSENGRGTIHLHVAHLWKEACDCSPEKCAIPGHVKAMCPGCHLRYDTPLHGGVRGLRARRGSAAPRRQKGRS